MKHLLIIFCSCTGTVMELSMLTLPHLLIWEDGTALRVDVLLSTLSIYWDLYLFFLWRSATLVFFLLTVPLSVLMSMIFQAGGCMGGPVGWCPVIVFSTVVRGWRSGDDIIWLLFNLRPSWLLFHTLGQTPFPGGYGCVYHIEPVLLLFCWPLEQIGWVNIK